MTLDQTKTPGSDQPHPKIFSHILSNTELDLNLDHLLSSPFPPILYFKSFSGDSPRTPFLLGDTS